MGKIKSAICIALFTLLIAALCFVCTVSFSYGTNELHTFNSILRMTAKDADLGAPYGSDGYLGGGYSAVYYPEGVISEKVFEDNYASYLEQEEKDEYAAKYVKYGNLYLEKDEVCGTGDSNEPSDAFKTEFSNTVALLEKRFAAIKKDGVRFEIRDEYTVSAFLPKDLMTNELYAFVCNAYMGEVTVRYGTAADSASTVLPARTNKTIRDYLKGASSRTAADGTVYVVINFTSLGRDEIAAATAEASSGSGNTLYFMIGENSVIPLSVSEALDQSSLYISGSYSAESAKICAEAINTALRYEFSEDTLELTLGESYFHEALYGSNALYAMYIAYGICFVAMAAFFFVRYRRLAFAHLYSYLIFLFVMILCVWSIPFAYISTETFLAFMLASLVFCVCNAFVFEKARGEYALGKTISSSVKNAYKRSMWHLIDVHLVLAALSFIVYGIALTNLSAFAFVFGLGVVLSGLATIGLTRFMWAIMIACSKNKGAFCNFKREEVEDDD